MDAAQTMQALYDSEINVSLSWFWDAGFDWKLGDALNGFSAKGCADTFEEAVQQIAEAARRHYPQSDFEKEWT